MRLRMYAIQKKQKKKTERIRNLLILAELK